MSEWIGVDLDGTLAEYKSKQWPAIGAPIAPMVDRVLAWLAAGTQVRIVTARASDPEQIDRVRAWCLEHLGQVLEVTCTKDYQMAELWDDRAVGVVKNLGCKAEDVAFSCGVSAMANAVAEEILHGDDLPRVWLREKVAEIQARIQAEGNQ